MIYFAKNSGQKPGTASLEYPLFHGSLPPYGYQAVTNVDFAGLNDYFYSPTGWETFILNRKHQSGILSFRFCFPVHRRIRFTGHALRSYPRLYF